MIGPKIHDRCFAKQHVLNEDFIDINKTHLQGQFKIFHLTTKRFGILQTTRTCGNLVFITKREKRVVSRNTDHEFSDRSWFRSVTHSPCFFVSETHSLQNRPLGPPIVRFLTEFQNRNLSETYFSFPEIFHLKLWGPPQTLRQTSNRKNSELTNATNSTFLIPNSTRLWFDGFRFVSCQFESN